MYTKYSDDMRLRYKIPLIIIMMMITTCSLFLGAYFFQNFESYAFDVVSNYPLTINYNTGSIIDENNYKNVKFSVVNDGDTDLLYIISLTTAVSQGDVIYALASDVTSSSGNFEPGNITDSVLIKAGEIHYYTLNILNDSEESFKGQILIVKEENEKLNFSQKILSENDVREKPVTNISSEISAGDEGLIKETTDNETTYYFRGAVENNYVSFAQNIWRIVKINNDGTVKLVLDSQIDVLSKYNTDTDYEFTSSTAYENLNAWYENNLSQYESFISDTYYCNDHSIVDSSEKIFAAYSRVVDNNIATYNCSAAEFESKVGLLTIDEIIYAGASTKEANSKFYLINENLENSFYTMSSAKQSGNNYYPFILDTKGKIVYDEVGTEYKAIRPVINISKIVTVTGDGSNDNPYVIE